MYDNFYNQLFKYMNEDMNYVLQLEGLIIFKCYNLVIFSFNLQSRFFELNK